MKRYFNCRLLVLTTIIVVILGNVFTTVGISLGCGEDSNYNYISNFNISDIDVSPNYQSDKTLFVQTKAAGIFKSTNKGRTWLRTTKHIKSKELANLTISPNYVNDQTLFCAPSAQREYDDVSLLGYILKSINGGRTWVNYSVGLPKKSISAIAISPNYSADNVVFAGLNSRGLYKSTNSGVSWARVSSNKRLNDSSIYHISISPNFSNDQTIIVTTLDDLYKSTDGGINWSPLNTGLSYEKVLKKVIFSPNYANDNKIFAYNEEDVVLSTNAGGSWTKIGTDIDDLSKDNLHISPSYASDQTIFLLVNYGECYRSTNSGNSWRSIGSFDNILDTDYFGTSNISLSPNYANDNTVFASSGPYIYISTNGGAIWNRISKGIGRYKSTISFLNKKTTKSGKTILSGRLINHKKQGIIKNQVCIFSGKKLLKEVRTDKFGYFKASVNLMKNYRATFFGNENYQPASKRITNK